MVIPVKVVQINAVCGKGSTGKICVDVSRVLTENGIENYILYSSGNSDYSLGIKFTNDKYIKLQALKSRIFGNYGFNSKRATKKLISELERIKPDAVHMHNIHSHDINLEMLFDFFRKTRLKVYWSFHDCWAFTGYCPHFAMAKCDYWKTQCHSCVQRKQYSWFFDKSEKLHKRKKELFSGLDLTIITPSKWLASVVEQSFLKEYDVKVLNNGIDLEIFKPTESNFREKYGLEHKKIILGVAFGWDNRKGVDVFIELSKRLPNDYQIVLVGTNDETDKLLPSNVISIHRTNNQTELAEIYTVVDVFANPTRQETFGLVNVEALACGTPVVTFNAGGSPEAINKDCGEVVEIDDIDAFENAIKRTCNEKLFSSEACIAQALKFEKRANYKKYLELYLSNN